MVAPAGPLATISCEPRQARKGAAAATDSGAGVWRAGVATIKRNIAKGGLAAELITRLASVRGLGIPSPIFSPILL